jgi:molybdopterin-containing oxidoreductase family membrane subunit
MKLNKDSIAFFEEFAPILERRSTKWKLWIGFLSICILFGLYGLFLQVRDGHIVTGMRDNVVWGIYIANFIFFIGISYAGAIISGILHLLKVDWRRPIIRIAMCMTVVTAVIGPFYIMLCIGRLDRLHYLFLHPRLQSPIIWDVLAITTFLVASILFLYLALIKDFAIYRDAENLKVPNWMKKLYKTLSLGYRNTPAQNRQIAISKNLMAIIMIPLVVLVSSVLSWIFGMTLRPGWHSSIFGPYFVLASIYSGVAVIIVTMWVFKKIQKLDKHILDIHFTYMGFIMLVFAAAYGYVTFSEFLTSWYVTEKWDGEVLDKLFNYDQYGWWFLYSNVVGIILPILVVAIPATRKSPKWITITAFLVVTTLWVKRYLIIVPTLESPLLPIQDIRPEYIYYSISWVEWALTIGGVATFLLFFSLISKFVTIIPMARLSYYDRRLKTRLRKEFRRHEKITD